MKEQEILGILTRAIESDHGVEVTTDNLDSFRQVCYKVRKKFDLKVSFKRCPTDPDRLWIVPDER
jgi:hypothetical protein